MIQIWFDGWVLNQKLERDAFNYKGKYPQYASWLKKQSTGCVSEPVNSGALQTILLLHYLKTFGISVLEFLHTYRPAYTLILIGQQ